MPPSDSPTAPTVQCCPTAPTVTECCPTAPTAPTAPKARAQHVCACACSSSRALISQHRLPTCMPMPMSPTPHFGSKPKKRVQVQRCHFPCYLMVLLSCATGSTECSPIHAMHPSTPRGAAHKHTASHHHCKKSTNQQHAATLLTHASPLPCLWRGLLITCGPMSCALGFVSHSYT